MGAPIAVVNIYLRPKRATYGVGSGVLVFCGAVLAVPELKYHQVNTQVDNCFIQRMHNLK